MRNTDFLRTFGFRLKSDTEALFGIRSVNRFSHRRRVDNSGRGRFLKSHKLFLILATPTEISGGRYGRIISAEAIHQRNNIREGVDFSSSEGVLTRVRPAHLSVYIYF